MLVRPGSFSYLCVLGIRSPTSTVGTADVINPGPVVPGIREALLLLQGFLASSYVVGWPFELAYKATETERERVVMLA